MIRKDHNFMQSLQLINEKLVALLSNYERADLYTSSLENAIKQKSARLSEPTRVQKSVALLKKKKSAISRTAGIAAGAAVTGATGVATTSIVHYTQSFIMHPLQGIVQGSGFFKPVLAPIVGAFSTYLYTTGMIVGVAAAVVFAYYCFSYIYKFIRTLTKSKISSLNKQFGFKDELLEWLPTENLLLEHPLFRLQCLLITLAVVSQLEDAFGKRDIEFDFNIERLFNKMEHEEEQLSLTEQKIYDLASEDAEKFIGQIKAIVKNPEKIKELKHSPTYQRLIKLIHEHLPSSINFEDDKKTSTYLAITAHVISKRCATPRDMNQFFHFLESALSEQSFSEYDEREFYQVTRDVPKIYTENDDWDRPRTLQKYRYFNSDSNKKRKHSEPVISIYMNQPYA